MFACKRTPHYDKSEPILNYVDGASFETVMIMASVLQATVKSSNVHHTNSTKLDGYKFILNV